MIENKNTILDMVQGGVKEVINEKISELLLNILDFNTDLKARELIIKVKLQPLDDRRKNINVSYHTQTKVRPINPVSTTVIIGTDENGTLQARELLDDISGQMMLNGGEVPQPTIIKFENKKEREQQAQ